MKNTLKVVVYTALAILLTIAVIVRAALIGVILAFLGWNASPAFLVLCSIGYTAVKTVFTNKRFAAEHGMSYPAWLDRETDALVAKEAA